MGQRLIVVSNSTPLINFAAIRRLDVLRELFGTITVPEAVEYELLQKGGHHLSAIELRQQWSELIDVRAITNRALCRMFRLSIDDGEAEALTLAIEHPPKFLLLDETRARTLAESYDLKVTGTLGCLIRAKQSGIIPAVKPLLDAMQTDARYWVSKTLYRRILDENHE